MRRKPRFDRLRAAVLVALGFAASLALASTAWATPTPPFAQCPPVGLDTSCAVLIEVLPNGELKIYHDPSQGPFDGVEDTLVGVQNNSSSTVTSIKLATAESAIPVFGFDGDGLCTASPQPEGCPFGPTGYEGPKTSFTVANEREGTVNFLEGAVAPGGSAYFSLEGPIAPCVQASCPPPPPPCSTAKGVGHFGPRGAEGTNENNSLSTSGKPKQFELTLPSGEHIHTYKLESATCGGPEGAREFSGTGKASINNEKGYSISFTIRQEGKKIFLTVLVEKESKVAYSITNQELNKSSKQTIF